MTQTAAVVLLLLTAVPAAAVAPHDLALPRVLAKAFHQAIGGVVGRKLKAERPRARVARREGIRRLPLGLPR